jgi:DNA polymerase III alpha subunit
MRLDNYGNPIFNEQDLFDIFYQGRSLADVLGLIVDKTEETSRFEKEVGARFLEPDTSGDSFEFFDEANQCDWFMPEDYCPDLIAGLYSMCETQEQRERVDKELELFIQHGMLDLLFYLKYLVDTLRQHNILWGVGRGSSVASYVLYLIGVHKIDSLKYNLDINEFLR